MSLLNQYKSLMTIFIQNTLSFTKLNKKGTKKGRILAILGIALAVLIIGIYIISNTIIISNQMIDNGLFSELIYLILLLSQIIVLFFGGLAALNYIYFSKDNSLLASLPIDIKVVFLAKFTMAYISELLFSSFILLPMLTTAAIVGITKGVTIAWHFFLIEILAVFLVPVVPLLFVTLLSMPAMYIVSFFKNRKAGNTIIIALFYVLIIAVSIGASISMSGLQAIAAEDGTLPASVINIFKALKNITIFNYPIAEALSNNNALLFTFLYIIAITAILAVTAMLSMLFYKRVFAVMSESTHNSKKTKKVAIKAETASIFKTFFIKEIRTLLNTPTLMISTVLSIIITPVMAFAMGMSFKSIAAEEPTSDYNFIMQAIGMMTFISYLMSSSTNMIAMIGISREGKNILFLKTLPVSIKTIIDSKLYFAMGVTILIALLCGIVMSFAVGFFNPILVIGIILVVLVGGINYNTMGLRNDLKNPNLSWTNVNELTRNNTRTLKPMLKSMLIGFYFMFLSIMFALQDFISGYGMYAVYYLLCLFPICIFGYFNYKKLYESAETLLENLEG